MTRVQSFDSPIGVITVYSDGEFLKSLRLFEKNNTQCDNPDDITHKTVCELKEYFAGRRKEFDIPLSYDGTDFQKRVWNALLDVPYGNTATYKDIALKIGSPNACRAVGGANNKNPIPIIIPCHRVIGSSGSLVGYAYGVDIKRRLLNFERSNIL